MRRTPALRALIRETDLAPRQLIAPLFVKEGIADAVPIASMPGQFQHTLESLRKEAVDIASRGVTAFMVFAVPEHKDADGSEASNPDGIAQRAFTMLHDELGDEHVVIGDLCLDEYTDHGHCGVLTDDGDVDNDATLERYRSIAVAQAEAGVTMVGPSGMMDGQVAAIRDALDAAGHGDVGIVAYAAKFASALYGPFRDAAECAPKFGDRAGYQMDPANGDEALREIRADIDEGADIVMVKPAVPVPGRDPPREGRDGVPDGRVPRVRRVRDDQGRRAERMAGRAARRARDADVDPPRRRRPDPHVPREGRRGLADGTRVTLAVQVTFDAADPAALAGFWKRVLDYIEQPPPRGGIPGRPGPRMGGSPRSGGTTRARSSTPTGTARASTSRRSRKRRRGRTACTSTSDPHPA